MTIGAVVAAQSSNLAYGQGKAVQVAIQTTKQVSVTVYRGGPNGPNGYPGSSGKIAGLITTDW